jgi:hypothetical protein
METPKLPSFGFNRVVFRPLALVPIKRVLGASFTIKVSELVARPQRVNNHCVQLRVL